MRIAATGAVIGLALAAGCAPVRPPPAAEPPIPEATIVGAAELARIRCLVVAPLENTSDERRLGEVATSALVASLDPEQTRVFPVEDLKRLFKGTSLELPPEGVSPRLALSLAEKVAADGVLYGAIEGNARDSSVGFVVTLRVQSARTRELVFAAAAPVRPTPGESLDVALRRAMLLAARPMLLKIGSPGERSCFDPELVRRARLMRAAPVVGQAVVAPEPAAPPEPPVPQPPAPAQARPEPAAPAPALAPAAVSSDPRAARPAELARKLDAGKRFVLEDVEFAGRTAVLVREQGLTDLARALAANPGTSVRIEVFVDGTDDPSKDARASMAQAMAVTRRLVGLGVARERIAQEARGGEDPLVPNFTSRGRAANRRVEVVGVKRR